MAVGFLFLLTPLETFVFEGTLAVIADEALWVEVPERSRCAHYFTNLVLIIYLTSLLLTVVSLQGKRTNFSQPQKLHKEIKKERIKMQKKIQQKIAKHLKEILLKEFANNLHEATM